MDVIHRDEVHYTAADLRRDLRIYPKLKSIAGHSLRPHVDFEEFSSSLVWYTLLREPIGRFISHYQHEVEKGNKSHDLLSWAREFRRDNWQVRMLAGTDDLEKAKDILVSRFSAVGFLEEYDASLSIFQQRLNLNDFDPRYFKKVNTAQSGRIKAEILGNPDKYQNILEEQNELDAALYKFAREQIWARQISEYGGIALLNQASASIRLDSQSISARKVWQNRAYRNLIYKVYARVF